MPPIASAAAALAWMAVEWMMRKKPSVLGIVSGAVAGLVAITPAAGFVTPSGALLTGVFAAEAIGGKPGLLEGNPAQLWAQAYGLFVTIAYGAAVSFAILKAIDWTIGLRVGEEVERDGLDLALHGETVA